MERLCVLGNYKFYLAFENSQLEGYVTEKVWEPLLMGAIPIYWGAPDINDFLPHPDAVIRVSDFDSMQALATYLNILINSPTAYQKHLQWRGKTVGKGFLNQSGSSPSRALCKMCDVIALEKKKYL